MIADLWYCGSQTSPKTEISKLCEFEDINYLTAFADYRIPQSLLQMGVIKYSDDLMQKLKSENIIILKFKIYMSTFTINCLVELLEEDIIEPNDRLEVEIRCVSLHAIELIREATEKINDTKCANINSVMIDTYLWSYAMKNQNDCQSLPHHKTRTYFY